jgi:hypothetical protein
LQTRRQHPRKRVSSGPGLMPALEPIAMPRSSSVTVPAGR